MGKVSSIMYFLNTVIYFIFVLQRDATLNKLIDQLVQYTTYTQHVLWSERHYSRVYENAQPKYPTFERNISALIRSHVITLACAINRIADTLGVPYPGGSITAASTIKYELPFKVWSEIRGFMVLNSFISDFLPFTDMFFREILQSMT